MIQEVYRQIKTPGLADDWLLEDYDMNIARYLVQGVDVWLNTPADRSFGYLRYESRLNGVLNFSVLDGWWREGYNGRNGWAIGNDTNEDVSEHEQDEADVLSLYDTLENEIVPLYYEQRSADGLPAEWIARMKESIRTVGRQFSMRRTVQDYMNTLYYPAILQGIAERNGKEEK